MHGKIKHKSPAYFVTSLQSYTKDEEYLCASPTTHLDARLSSKYHRSHVIDIGTGSCCRSPSRLAHLGEISLRADASCCCLVFSKATRFCTITLEYTPILFENYY